MSEKFNFHHMHPEEKEQDVCGAYEKIERCWGLWVIGLGFVFGI